MIKFRNDYRFIDPTAFGHMSPRDLRQRAATMRSGTDRSDNRYAVEYLKLADDMEDTAFRSKPAVWE